MQTNNKGKDLLTRKNEVSVIAYLIPNSNVLILGKSNTGNWLVKTSDGIMSYTTSEMDEIYNLDLNKSDMEHLTTNA
ncbi:hypothetical protein N8Z33_00945 [Flavobacteriaceae bacterium]|nr:hypothetical protein [Flavobacteriaceae bacterium]